MSKPAKTLVAIAPHGRAVTKRTSSDYDFAGLVLGRDGWRLAEQGWSHNSVTSRTRSYFNRNPVTAWVVVPFREQAPHAVWRYFGERGSTTSAMTCLAVTAVYAPGEGWQDSRATGRRVYPGTSVLRRMAREGITAVQIDGTGFQMRELTR